MLTILLKEKFLSNLRQLIYITLFPPISNAVILDFFYLFFFIALILMPRPRKTKLNQSNIFILVFLAFLEFVEVVNDKETHSSLLLPFFSLMSRRGTPPRN